MHTLSKKPQQGIPEMATLIKDIDHKQHRLILQRIAHRAMLEKRTHELPHCLPNRRKSKS
jgi:hypothetical protein